MLVLPGGKVHSRQPSRPWQLARIRTGLLARSLQRDLGPDYRIQQIRYRFRGWNAPSSDALDDADQALRTLVAREGERTTYLVGHSMGARVCAHLAARHDIAGIVALAPWWPENDADRIPSHCRLLVLHGTADRWTDPQSSRRQVDVARARGLDATWEAVPGAGHFMLSRPRIWHRRAADFIADPPRAA